MLLELVVMDGSHWDLDGFLRGTNYSDKTEVSSDIGCNKECVCPS